MSPATKRRLTQLNKIATLVYDAAMLALLVILANAIFNRVE